MSARWVLCLLLPCMARAADLLPGPMTPPGQELLIIHTCAGADRPQRIDLAAALDSAMHEQPDLIMAHEDVSVARAQVKAAGAAFLPSVQFIADEERYVPNHANAPVVVIGNNVIGGAQSKSAYGSFSLNWNLMDSGKDLAAYRGAKAGVRAAGDTLDSTFDDTLIGVLRAYADLFESEIRVRAAALGLRSARRIEARATDRYQHGHGTMIAVGQASASVSRAEDSLNRACRRVADKASDMAEAIGRQMPSDQRLSVVAALPLPVVDLDVDRATRRAIDETPAVRAAHEKVNEARQALMRARRSFGPSLSFSIRRDYLGEDLRSLSIANDRIAPNDYRMDLTLEQPLFSMRTELAQVDKERAALRKAEAAYDKARLTVQTRLRDALSAQREAQGAYRDAQGNLADAQRILTLTRSLYEAGRTDEDNVDRARMDRDRARADLDTAKSRRALAQWVAARALEPGEFAGLLARELGRGAGENAAQGDP